MLHSTCSMHKRCPNISNMLCLMSICINLILLAFKLYIANQLVRVYMLKLNVCCRLHIFNRELHRALRSCSWRLCGPSERCSELNITVALITIPMLIGSARDDLTFWLKSSPTLVNTIDRRVYKS